MVAYCICAVDGGGSMNFRDCRGRTALDLAHTNDNRVIIDLLTAAGGYRNFLFFMVCCLYSNILSNFSVFLHTLYKN